MRFVIRAYENRYGGLHGIENWETIKAETLYEAEEEAREMSRAVMGSYSFIEDELEEVAQFYCNDLDDERAFSTAYNEAVEENIAYSIWKIKDDCEYSLIEIDHFLALDPFDFVDDYCELVEDC